MLKKILTLSLCIVGLLTALPTTAQRVELNKYWVKFKDKAGSPYSVWQPEAYLSPRAIERRRRAGVRISEQDFPVNPSYIAQVRALGAAVYTTSRWLNGATVYVADSNTLPALRALPFVASVEATGKFYKNKYNLRKIKQRDELQRYPTTTNPWGWGYNQIAMLNGTHLHQLGYKGKGMLVAVIDGGFTNVDIMPFFDSLRATNRLLNGNDFVDKDDYVYESNQHGAQVLSAMAANLPNMLVGTAPDATYVCLRTEDTRSELRIEEDNWVAAVEYADSIGADVINSSLGYTTFTLKTMNYTYESLDGNTSRASQAANIAAAKGMLVVVSAGNEGNGSWRYVGAPADAQGVLAVGAVTRNGTRAYFSSIGPTPDGRVKPDVVARGELTVLGSIYGYKVDSANGTSFAAPVMAGMATALWQAAPHATNYDLMQALRQCASRSQSPDHLFGYGIPDVWKAYQTLHGTQWVDLSAATDAVVVRGSFSVVAENPARRPLLVQITIRNALGATVAQAVTRLPAHSPARHLLIPEAEHWASGVYTLVVDYLNNPDMPPRRVKVVRQ